jgi:hypothetical protein
MGKMSKGLFSFFKIGRSEKTLNVHQKFPHFEGKFSHNIKSENRGRTIANKKKNIFLAALTLDSIFFN